MSRTKILSTFVAGLVLLLGGALYASGSMAAEAMNWFGGPVYDGPPTLGATAALVKAGGGPGNFTFPKALVSMLGEKTVNAEVAKLNKQYGEKDTKAFLDGMTYAVKDGLQRATEAGVTLPSAPPDLKGTALAKTLVQAGTVDGTFWSGHLFDKALSHPIHNTVMADIEAKSGRDADQNVHRILNQAMYDVAQALGMKDVGLASLH
ncbi:MAG: hypothetical protein H3C59_07085 [Burkholderiaceae bacterium]|nr:hypothetical protein [Burkholderiaceae bacterium]